MNLSKIQLTLGILKPDITRTPHAYQAIKSILEREKFLIIKRKVVQLKREDLEIFYEDHKNKFFYNRLITFMMSGPLEALILGHENAVLRWRQVMGPTKVFKAHYEAPETIRGMVGLTDTRNSAHGSDSAEAAIKEIKFFFPEFSFEKWKQEGAHVTCLKSSIDDYLSENLLNLDTVEP